MVKNIYFIFNLPLLLTLASCTSSISQNALAVNSLDFRKQPAVQKSTELNGQTIRYRAYEDIVYVKNPVDIEYQTINIYIPEAYYNNQKIDGYTANTAPIFLPNQIGGYMPAKPGKPGLDQRSGQANALLVALSKGYVVASPGARGRTAANGKAPAAIIDLKAAVRYLHANDAVMPGDARKIISNGTSAGGALSALLGASGNSQDYQNRLVKLGAANASDSIFAVSAYCPITDLEHADMAYEWQFNGVNDYKKINITMLDYQVKRELLPGTLTETEKTLSTLLKTAYPAYINSLHLKDNQGRPLTLDVQGNGSFKNYIASYLAASAQKQLDEGKNLSDRNWLTIHKGKISSVDFDLYAKAAGRQKTPPAFDAVDLSSGENQLFGTASTDKQHFTAFSKSHSTVKDSSHADSATIKMMNPLNYIGNNLADTAAYWRIRAGSADRDTSLAVSAILATKLQNHGYHVDYAIPWDVPHSGDYDLDELFAWMKQISSLPLH
ncbi:alpha/beta hydrolase [Neisseria arctica]|uniref:Alpha/beta hydrolase n=1 Tax=Neisseria arctica TaxID=1470200 RepID=A0A0J0YRE7_9NEIS|nr:subtype B tannase [Neisseria arctica]KLT72690.1 alpha/beta hydrolase [Neisseria arctica]UOO86224.1 alpha/beta hydrolase [Neisseria arctica]